MCFKRHCKRGAFPGIASTPNSFTRRSRCKAVLRDHDFRIDPNSQPIQRRGRGDSNRRRRIRRSPRAGGTYPSRPNAAASVARDGTGPRAAIRVSRRLGPLLRLQSVRHGLPFTQWPRRGGDLARGWAPDRWLEPTPRDAARDVGLPPLSRPGLSDGLPSRRLREESGHGNRQASRRPMLRLPLLYVRLSV